LLFTDTQIIGTGDTMLTKDVARRVAANIARLGRRN